MKKDWGFSALIEYDGKRVLFDTGNNADIFCAQWRRGFAIPDLVVLFAGAGRALRSQPNYLPAVRISMVE
jgi:hypothetical protein